MRDGSRNRHFGLAFQNVESRGSKLAFAANDFALAEPALDDGAAIQLEKCSGDALKDRYLQEIFGFESLRVQTNSDRGPHNAFVGERARWA